MPVAWENPFPGQRLAVTEFRSDVYGINPDLLLDDEIDEANLVTSLVAKQPKFTFSIHHKPVIDIDLPVKVLPSTTPGHSHLFIDKDMPWDDYIELLTVMVKVGIVEPGYLEASKQRGYTSVRLPWIKKETR